MQRLKRGALLTPALAVIAVLIWAGAASAATSISITGGSLTAVSSRESLSGSAFGSVIMNKTLNVTLVGGTRVCSGTQLLQIGTVASGGATVVTPAGAVATLLFPTAWTVNVHCTGGVLDVDGTGQLLVTLLGIQIGLRVTPFLAPLYSGSKQLALNAGGTAMTVFSNALTSGSFGTAALRGTFALSPAIGYTLI